MTDPLRRNLVGYQGQMARKAKVYGKQKTNELADAFQNLNLATPPKGSDFSYCEKRMFCNSHSSGPYIDVQQSPALTPVTGNKCRANRIKNKKLKDEPAYIENVPKRRISHPFHGLICGRLNLLLVDEIPVPHGPEKTAQSAGRLKKPQPGSKPTDQTKLLRAFVSNAKSKQLSIVTKGKQKLMIE